MNATTIKLRQKTKTALEDFRQENESYDKIINKLISLVKKKHLKQKLIEGYKSQGKKDIKILHEWEVASSEVE